jgi:hypothetical protein
MAKFSRRELFRRGAGIAVVATLTPSDALAHVGQQVVPWTADLLEPGHLVDIPSPAVIQIDTPSLQDDAALFREQILDLIEPESTIIVPQFDVPLITPIQFQMDIHYLGATYAALNSWDWQLIQEIQRFGAYWERDNEPYKMVDVWADGVHYRGDGRTIQWERFVSDPGFIVMSFDGRSEMLSGDAVRMFVDLEHVNRAHKRLGQIQSLAFRLPEFADIHRFNNRQSNSINSRYWY